MFTYSSSYSGFILDCINNGRYPQVKEKEKTLHIRDFSSILMLKILNPEMLIQEKKIIFWLYLDVFDICASAKKISVLLSW